MLRPSAGQRSSCRKLHQIGNEKRARVEESLWIGSWFANARETGLWEVSYELVQQLVTGRGVDLGWSRLSHFQRGVVFHNPVFDFNVKLFCLDDDLFCFCVGRNIGESVVDSISLPS